MRFLLILAIWGICTPVFANTLTMEQSIELGLQNSSVQYQDSVHKALDYQELKDANRLINPDLEYEYDFEEGHSMSVSQPLRPSDLTGARFSYKKILNEQTNIYNKLDSIALVHLLTNQYYELYILQEELKYTKENKTFVEKALNILKGKIYQSSFEKTESLLFEADGMALTNYINDLNAQYIQKKQLFIVQLNLGNDYTLQQPSEIVLPSKEKVLDNVNSLSSLREVLIRNKMLAETELSITKQDAYFPTLAPKIAYNFEYDKWIAGVTLSIPLWNKQEASISRANLKQKRNELDLKHLDLIGFRTIVEQAYDRTFEAVKKSDDYFNVILPNYQESLKQMEQEYIAGNTTILSFWQIKEKLSEAQIKALQSLQQSILTIQELEQLLGTFLEEI